jgi:hypothetical protein
MWGLVLVGSRSARARYRTSVVWVQYTGDPMATAATTTGAPTAPATSRAGPGWIFGPGQVDAGCVGHQGSRLADDAPGLDVGSAARLDSAERDSHAGVMIEAGGRIGIRRHSAAHVAVRDPRVPLLAAGVIGVRDRREECAGKPAVREGRGRDTLDGGSSAVEHGLVRKLDQAPTGAEGGPRVPRRRGGPNAAPCTRHKRVRSRGESLRTCLSPGRRATSRTAAPSSTSPRSPARP